MRPHPARKGFTFIEIILVVAIISIISVMGYGTLSKALPRYRTRQAAMEFASSMDQLRTMSIVNNREYRVYLEVADDQAFEGAVPSTGTYWLQAGNRSSGSTFWDTFPVEPGETGDSLTGEGRVDISMGGEDARAHVSIIPWASLAGPNHGMGAPSNTDCVVFSPRGWVTNPSADFASYSDGYIRVEFINKAALADGQTEVYAVRIARSGFARVDFAPTSLFREVGSHTVGTVTSTTH